MRRRGLWIAVAAVAVTAAVFGGAQSIPVGSRAGQIVFVPAPVEGGTSVDSSVGSITLTSCSVTPDGLRVTGHVSSSAELAAVVVTPSQVDSAGLVVGAGFAASAGKVPDAVPGDFAVTLVWANASSAFQVADATSFSSGHGPVRVGVSTRCPSR